MESEELRPIVLQILKNWTGQTSLQIVSLTNAVEDFGAKKGIYPEHTGTLSLGTGREIRMPEEDRVKVRQIVWQLIIEGILVPGVSDLQPDLPFLTVTEYGRKCLEEEGITPHDPDGYLKYVRDQVPSLDPIAEIYIAEALHAYRMGLMLSSTVMLGAASEKAFNILFDTYVSAIQDGNRKSRLQGVQDRFIKPKFEAFRKDFELVKKTLPKDLSENVELQLDAVFNLIRITRNDAGHPTGGKIDRGLAYSNLRIFVPYLKRIYDLIGHFSKNSA